jgi:hypothetical protein
LGTYFHRATYQDFSLARETIANPLENGSPSDIRGESTIFQQPWHPHLGRGSFGDYEELRDKGNALRNCNIHDARLSADLKDWWCGDQRVALPMDSNPQSSRDQSKLP